MLFTTPTTTVYGNVEKMAIQRHGQIFHIIVLGFLRTSSGARYELFFHLDSFVQYLVAQHIRTNHDMVQRSVHENRLVTYQALNAKHGIVLPAEIPEYGIDAKTWFFDVGGLVNATLVLGSPEGPFLQQWYYSLKDAVLHSTAATTATATGPSAKRQDHPSSIASKLGRRLPASSDLPSPSSSSSSFPIPRDIGVGGGGGAWTVSTKDLTFSSPSLVETAAAAVAASAAAAPTSSFVSRCCSAAFSHEQQHLQLNRCFTEGYVYLAARPSEPGEFKIGCDVDLFAAAEALNYGRLVDQMQLVYVYPCRNRFLVCQYFRLAFLEAELRNNFFMIRNDLLRVPLMAQKILERYDYDVCV